MYEETCGNVSKRDAKGQKKKHEDWEINEKEEPKWKENQ